MTFSFFCVFQRGETALHMAARAGQADVVRYLLKNGAKVETKSKVRTRGSLSITEPGTKNKQRYKYWAKRVTFSSFLLRRMTRQRCTSPVGWGKSTSSSSCCSAAPLPTLPPPQATPPFTWLPAKDTRMLLPCCWRTEPRFPPPLRWVRWRNSLHAWRAGRLFFFHSNTETHNRRTEHLQYLSAMYRH